MSEVNLDKAVDCLRTEKNDLVYAWMDDVVKEVVEHLDNFDNPPELEALKILINNEHFKKKLSSLSVVQCFKTFLGNLEKLKYNVARLTEEQEAAVELVAKDLAAAFQRFQHCGFSFEERSSLGDLSWEKEEWSEAYQHYCDALFMSCLQSGKKPCFVDGRRKDEDLSCEKSRKQLFLKSTLNQIKCLLRLGEFENATKYVVRANLFKEGPEEFSNTLTDEFDKNELVKTSVEQVVKSRKVIFDKYLDYMDEAGGATEEEVDFDRKSATIIVNPNGVKGLVDGKFYLKDLQTAFNFAKNGGIIFLENGNYEAGKHFEIKQLSSDPSKAITIIGASTNDCSIHGSIKISANVSVTLKRLKLEVGEDASSSAALYILGGETKFENCLFEVPVNTGIYVIGQEGRKSGLEMKHCIVDGLEACQRVLAFQGDNVAIFVEDCIFSDMFSVLTVQAPQQITNKVKVCVNNSVFHDVQDGIKVVLHGASEFESRVTGCQMNLVMYDQEMSSSGIEVWGGNVVARNNYIFMNHIDGKAFHVANTQECLIEQNLIGSTSEIERKLSMGAGVVVDKVDRVSLTKLNIYGFLFGIKMKDCQSVQMESLWLDQCSVGIHVEKCEKEKRKKMSLNKCSLRMMYYGVMCQSQAVQLVVKNSTFWDVPKAFLVTQEVADELVDEGCEYLNTRDYTCDEGFGVLEEEMNLYLATQQNLPHRVFYDRGELRRIEKTHQKFDSDS